jgi:hypothetical protein
MITCNSVAIGVVLCIGICGLTALLRRKQQPQRSTTLSR